MSRLMIRGGYGEHGRSCFLVEYGSAGRMYMVDSGIMDTDPFPYPDVTEEELERVDYLFLTHCHKDHSGAFGYFCERGFKGTLVTTGMTCALAGIEYEKIEFLTVDTGASMSDEDVPMPGMERSDTQVHANGNIRKFGPLTVRYGRTGHCPGGLWFEITDCADTILFSGDYQEDTLVYVCDPIRESHAKMALVDCAHRGTELDAKALREQIVRVVTEKLQSGRKVILPVPQFGRGLELLFLMKKEFPNLRVRVDQDFVVYAKKMLSEPVWYYEDAYQALHVNEFDMLAIFGGLNGESDYDILLIADTHLKKRKNVDFVHHAVVTGAAVLINGRVKKNGPVGKLLDAGKAEKFLFPHHQSYGDLIRLVHNNDFQVTLPFHNNEKEVLV